MRCKRCRRAMRPVKPSHHKQRKWICPSCGRARMERVRKPRDRRFDAP